MSNIDWSKAPCGAGWHALSETSSMEYWYGIVNSELSMWFTDGWKKSRFNSIGDVAEEFFVTARPDFQPFTSIEDAQPYTRDDAIKFLIENIKNFPSNDDSQPVCNGWKWIHVYGPMMAFSNGVKAEAIFETDFNHAKKIYRDSLRTVNDDAQPEPDMVNHPPHYQSDNGIECIDAIRAALGRDGFIAYCIGNSMKYQWREKADKLEDMRKAAWYLNRAIEEQSK